MKIMSRAWMACICICVWAPPAQSDTHKEMRALYQSLNALNYAVQPWWYSYWHQAYQAHSDNQFMQNFLHDIYNTLHDIENAPDKQLTATWIKNDISNVLQTMKTASGQQLNVFQDNKASQNKLIEDITFLASLKTGPDSSISDEDIQRHEHFRHAAKDINTLRARYASEDERGIPEDERGIFGYITYPFDVLGDWFEWADG